MFLIAEPGEYAALRASILKLGCALAAGRRTVEGPDVGWLLGHRRRAWGAGAYMVGRPSEVASSEQGGSGAVDGGHGVWNGGQCAQGTVHRGEMTWRFAGVVLQLNP